MTRSPARHQRSPIVAIFILSGVAGLIYEVVWSRQLVLVFGNTTQAVSAILTAFFIGMAVGNVLGGRLADRVARPLRLYAYLELALVPLVLVTPISFRLIGTAYGWAFDSLETAPGTLALVRFSLALLALGPATVLMGATLPTLTRQLTQHADGLSTSFGRLYAANTMGAVIGAAVSGLVLIEALGLSGALVVGAVCSGSAGLMAMVLDRRAGSPATEDPVIIARSPIPAGDIGRRGRQMLAIALGFAFVSGLTALGYQTLWTRLLASGTGNSTYVFTFVLIVFLSGLTLGAALYNSVRHRIKDPIAVLAGGQALVSVLAIAGLIVMSRTGSTSPSPFALGPSSILVVFPPTLFMGFGLPVASQLVASDDHNIGGRAGMLLAVNTFGSVLGAFAIPFVVIPAVGSPVAVALLALVNAATAVVLGALCFRSRRSRSGLPLAGAVASLLAVIIIFSIPGLLLDPSAAAIVSGGGTVFASSEDEIASTQAGVLDGQRQLWVTGTSMTGLTVDTRLMADLPLALRPESKSALVVAFGMGSAFRSALRLGLKTDAVELVPSVPGMFHWFYEDADKVVADPLGRIIVSDGRNYVDLTDRRYDIVVVDPPPPSYSAGVSVISSEEFYRSARARLTPGGVMLQWVPFGGTVDQFKDHVRTFATVFPHVLIAFGGSPDNGVFMFGSDDPLSFDRSALEAVFSKPGVVQDLSAAYDAPTDTVAGWLDLVPRLVIAADEDVRRLAGPGPLVTDDRPLPEYFLFRRALESSSLEATHTSVEALRP